MFDLILEELLEAKRRLHTITIQGLGTDHQDLELAKGNIQTAIDLAQEGSDLNKRRIRG